MWDRASYQNWPKKMPARTRRADAPPQIRCGSHILLKHLDCCSIHCSAAPHRLYFVLMQNYGASSSTSPTRSNSSFQADLLPALKGLRPTSTFTS